jgi:ABC-type multidrug transport system fused ATPase/permease subunit
VLSLAIPIWISVWSAADDQTNVKYFYILAAISGGACIGSLFRNIALMKTLLRANKYLHDKLFYSVIRSPVTFFDSTPAGRILNRFSKDTDVADDMLITLIVDLA